MGCAVQFHVKPKQRKLWGKHSKDGWYLGMSDEHYCCHVVFVRKTRSKRVSDTVFFKHKYITQPTVTPADAIVKALQNLARAIKGEQNSKGEAQFCALEQLQAVFLPGNTLVPEQFIPKCKQPMDVPAPTVETPLEVPAPRVEPAPRVTFAMMTPKVISYNPSTVKLRAMVPAGAPMTKVIPTLLIVTSPQPSPKADTSIAAQVKA